MATLHLLYGLPCSGKSTLAKKLENEHPALLLVPDEWMHRIVGDGYNDEKRAVVEAIQWEIAEKVLKLGIDVIWEGGSWNRKERDALKEKVKNIGATTKLYFLDVPPEELLRRLKERNANLPTNTFHIKESDLEEWMKVFEGPTADESDLIIVR
jgi:predicted kinase